jgi:hypothetical protein
MRVIELRADAWETALDFINALKAAIGAPDWHGSSPDAFLDSIVYHDEINALKAPYTIKIIGIERAQPAAQVEARLTSRLINEAAARDRGTDLEVTIIVENSN